jgi:hypothetical protein
MDAQLSAEMIDTTRKVISNPDPMMQSQTNNLTTLL